MLPMKAMVDPSSDHLGRGDAFERAGRYAEAAEAYRDAVVSDPQVGDLATALELHAETV